MANFFDQEGGDGADIFDPGGFFHQNKSKNPDLPAQLPNTYSDTLAAISQSLFADTAPARTNLLNRSNAFLGGGLDVTASPMYGSLKSAVDSQFGRARDNTIANTAAGGGLVDALSNQETQRAQTMTQGIGQLAQSELDRATGLATGLLPIGTGGLGKASETQAQTNASLYQAQIQQQQQQQAQQQQTGSAAGEFIGGVMGK